MSHRYCFDLDGVLVTNTDGKYCEAKPIENVIACANRLYEKGHTIIIYTARGMGTCNGNAGDAFRKWHSITEKQLKEFGIKYHQLIFGKPEADVYIDDRAIDPFLFFE